MRLLQLGLWLSSKRVLGSALNLYRRLLRQYRLDLAVLLRRSGAAGRWKSWLRLASGSVGLFVKALPTRPMGIFFSFLFEGDDPDPFIPAERQPVRGEVKKLLTAPEPLIRLSHPGVIRLQGAIAGRELARRLEIPPARVSAAAGEAVGAVEAGEAPGVSRAGGTGPGADRTTGQLLLGSFAGVDRLLSSLLTAAGGRAALRSVQELGHRIDIVLPLFLQILSIQAGGTQGEIQPGMKFRGKRRGKMKKRRDELLTFDRSLYPQALGAARGRIIAENRNKRAGELCHRMEILTEQYRFRLFTEATELLHRLDTDRRQLKDAAERLSWNYDL